MEKEQREELEHVSILTHQREQRKATTEGTQRFEEQKTREEEGRNPLGILSCSSQRRKRSSLLPCSSPCVTTLS